MRNSIRSSVVDGLRVTSCYPRAIFCGVRHFFRERGSHRRQLLEAPPYLWGYLPPSDWSSQHSLHSFPRSRFSPTTNAEFEISRSGLKSSGRHVVLLRLPIGPQATSRRPLTNANVARSLDPFPRSCCLVEPSTTTSIS